MRFRVTALLAVTTALGASAVALAAVAPKAHTAFLYVEFGHFSIALDTKASKQVTAGAANPTGGQHPVSGILVVCPSTIPGAPVRELHLGFPGATLRPVKGHYTFSRSYTQRNAPLVTPVGGHTTVLAAVKVKVTGTATSARLITGTVSVTVPECSLKTSRYRAKFLSTLP
jgi:hypothetical protein